jgi:chorismate dehydratase
LNTKPLLYGIQRSALIDEINLRIDYPSSIADLLLSDEIDIGLVPVAIIPEMKEYHINTNYCIACDGPIASVCIFSESPIETTEKILLDYQSRTSVMLAKILLKEYWKIRPELVDGGEDFTEDIQGKTAGLVIGDRALEQRRKSKYIYDLGEAWKNLTGLPFVFAAWVSNKNLEDSFVDQFDKANGFGIHHIEDVLAGLNYNGFDLHEYYTRFIRYEFDGMKRKGMDLFLEKLEVQSHVH